jgi:hypothetical protein
VYTFCYNIKKIKEMIRMLMEQATMVRKEWSSVCDSVIHGKPKFIKRTRDKMWFSNLETMEEILSGYSFSAERYVEEDGTVTLSLNEIDLIENGTTEQQAREALGVSILEYSTEFYNHYELYSKSMNRKGHIPYIFKALIMDDAKKIGESIQCQDGKN